MCVYMLYMVYSLFFFLMISCLCNMCVCVFYWKIKFPCHNKWLYSIVKFHWMTVDLSMNWLTSQPSWIMEAYKPFIWVALVLYVTWYLFFFVIYTWCTDCTESVHSCASCTEWLFRVYSITNVYSSVIIKYCSIITVLKRLIFVIFQLVNWWSNKQQPLSTYTHAKYLIEKANSEMINNCW